MRDHGLDRYHYACSTSSPEMRLCQSRLDLGQSGHMERPSLVDSVFVSRRKYVRTSHSSWLAPMAAAIGWFSIAAFQLSGHDFRGRYDAPLDYFRESASMLAFASTAASVVVMSRAHGQGGWATRTAIASAALVVIGIAIWHGVGRGAGLVLRGRGAGAGDDGRFSRGQECSIVDRSAVGARPDTAHPAQHPGVLAVRLLAPGGGLAGSGQGNFARQARVTETAPAAAAPGEPRTSTSHR